MVFKVRRGVHCVPTIKGSHGELPLRLFFLPSPLKGEGTIDVVFRVRWGVHCVLMIKGGHGELPLRLLFLYLLALGDD